MIQQGIGSLRRPSAVLLFVMLALVTLLLTWQVRHYARSLSIAEVHQQGEARLLRYITAIRQTLNRSNHLPYVLSQNEDVRALLLGDTGLAAKVNLFLEQTNQIVTTARWMVLDNSGHVAASSDWREQGAQVGRYYGDRPFFFKAREGELGHYVQLPDMIDLPGYYLSAPIYDELQLIGVAVVMFDLQELQELWGVAQERLLVTDKEGLIFLSSMPEWLNRRLPGFGYLESSKLLPLRWQRQQLHDGTEIDRLEGEGGESFLVQSVTLDDLGWQVHFLSSLAPLRQQLQTITFFCLGGGLALALLVLFFRERWLRNLSLRQAQALRLHNEAQQRAIISNTQSGLLTVDTHGRILFINPRALHQFGGTEREVLGRDIASLIDLQQSPEPLRRMVEALEQGIPATPLNALEGVARRTDGSGFPMLISLNPIAWEDRDGYLVTLVDITLRKRAERALQQANEELEQRVLERTRELREAQAELIQSSKLAALGTMSAAIAHELNQPLTAIRTTASSCKLLLQRQQFDAVEENLQRMADMTERMALISAQLKTFAHKRSDKLDAVDLGAVCVDVLAMFDDRLEAEAVQLQQALPKGIAVQGDRPRLEQVLINLVRNALDAMQDSQRRCLDIELQPQPGQALLRISDSGSGLSEEALAHLFDPFFTTKEVGEGLGLGLSISYGIIRDLEGQIRADNRPQGGACFTLTLPLAPAQTATGETGT